MRSFLKTSGYIVLYLFIYFIYQVQFTIIASIFLLMLGVDEGNLFMVAIPILVPSAIISLIFYWLILKHRRIKIVDYCQFKKVKVEQVLLIVLGIISLSAVIQVVISEIVKFFPEYSDTSSSINNSIGGPFSILCVTILIPIFEEILFRGIIFNDLRRKINVNLAIFIQGILFGIYHFNTIQSAYAAVLGIILGFFYIWTESIFSTIAAHITFNICGVILIPYLFYIFPNYTYQFAIAGIVIFFATFIGVYTMRIENAQEY